mmetsp:Transcript_42451/g.49531  ORF Transcript_42451/g.49531 Transcript_42451/m.49531 type:complete len:114 (-) Transcript_42451:649-990(-)
MTSSGMMNRLVKAARGTEQLDINNARFRMEKACNFGGDYKIKNMSFYNWCHPSVAGLTSRQLELIAQGIAASSLKHSLNKIVVEKKGPGIGKKETERVLYKHGLTKITVTEWQ